MGSNAGYPSGFRWDGGNASLNENGDWRLYPLSAATSTVNVPPGFSERLKLSEQHTMHCHAREIRKCAGGGRVIGMTFGVLRETQRQKFDALQAYHASVAYDVPQVLNLGLNGTLCGTAVSTWVMILMLIFHFHEVSDKN